MPHKKEFSDIYKREANRVIKLIENAQYQNRDKFLRAIRAGLNLSLKDMLESTREFLGREISQMWLEGLKEASKSAPGDNNALNKMVATLAAQGEIASYINSIYLEVATTTKLAYQDFYREIRADIKVDNASVPTAKIVDRIKKEFVKKGLFNVNYKDGKRMSLDTHVNMLARTAKQRMFNKAGIKYAEETSDLVKCTRIFPTCEICAKFQGRVYSISGKDKRYPALYKTALVKGYEVMHPNCRHQFLPYFPEYAEASRPEQARVDREVSNRPFTDDRTEHNRREYQLWQAKSLEKYEKRRKKLFKVKP